MKNKTIKKQLPSIAIEEGAEANITGLLHNFRVMSWGVFIFIRYENYLIQCIGNKEIFNTEELRKESYVKLSGTFVSANIKNNMINPNNLEIKLTSFEVLNTSKYEILPLEISKKEVNTQLNNLFNHRQLSLRNMTQKSIFTISSHAEMAFSNSLVNLGFTKINSPKIVNIGAEGGSEVFSLKYFEQNAFLTQSPQFYKQMMIPVFGKVFEVNPVFRAEKFNSSRHVNEYISLDIEMCLENNFNELIETEAFILNEIFKSLKEHCAYEINLLNLELPNIENYLVLKFQEVHEIVLAEFGNNYLGENDLSPEEEKLICEYAKNKYNTEFVFVTHYPTSKRPFYTKCSEENPEETLSFDLLFRGIEITTGGERIHEYSKLKEKMNTLNMNEEELYEYLETFKYGMPKHGGFGLGLERLVSKIYNLENVKEASLFPRDRNRLKP
jgi:nondiscriminating aspartyl-tRNA synthetase